MSGFANESDHAELSAEQVAAKARSRVLVGFLALVLLILCGYFYWVSQELERIQHPSILVSPNDLKAHPAPSSGAIPMPTPAIPINKPLSQYDEAVPETVEKNIPYQSTVAPVVNISSLSSKVLRELDEKIIAQNLDAEMLQQPILNVSSDEPVLTPVPSIVREKKKLSHRPNVLTESDREVDENISTPIHIEVIHSSEVYHE